MIELGATGPYVRAWQRVVHAKPDGRFGPLMDIAVRGWQTVHGIDPDGVIGQLTRAKLDPGDLIKPYEGLSLRAYDDAQDVPLSMRYIHRVGQVWRRLDGSACRGYATIGWGRRLYGNQWVESCTRAQADAWFVIDLELTRMPAVRRYQDDPKYWPTPWDPGMVMAACSFTYNCGTGALGALALSGFAEAHWMSYVHTRNVIDPGLVSRREEEYACFTG